MATVSLTPVPPKRHRRWWLLVLLLLVIAGGVYWWMHGSSDAKDKGHKLPQAPITVAPTARKNVPVYLSGLGTVQAYNTVTVHSQVDGQLIAVKFREGQMVRAGDVLAQIDPRTFKAAYDQSVANTARDAANLANARVDLRRYENLGNSIPRQTLDTQRATVKQLEATVAADHAAAESTGTQLSYTTITAPISGRTGIRQVDMGNIVHASDTNGIVVVTQLEPISILFSLPQQNLDEINHQMMAQKKLAVDALAADGSVTDSGVLELIDNEIDQTTGTIKLKSTFPNRKHLLWPGGFTNVRLLLDMQQNALTIPTVAIQHGPQGAYVFVYHEPDSTVLITPVTVGITQDQDTVILQGLNDGEQVVTDGMAKLHDKSKVTLGKGRDTSAASNAPPNPNGTPPNPANAPANPDAASANSNAAPASANEAATKETSHRHAHGQSE